MSLDLTTVLGRLLTDSRLRRQFFDNRAATAARLGADPTTTGLLEQLDADTLEQQAAGLIDKRFHEVAQLLPRTMQQLGRRASSLFHDFAESFWPESHRRHLIDAAKFCRHLQQHRLAPVCRTEYNRIEFRLSRRTFALHFVSDYYVDDRRRLAVQFLTRTKNGVPSESVWFLRFPTFPPLPKTLGDS